MGYQSVPGGSCDLVAHVEGSLSPTESLEATAGGKAQTTDEAGASSSSYAAEDGVEAAAGRHASALTSAEAWGPVEEGFVEEGWLRNASSQASQPA